MEKSFKPHTLHWVVEPIMGEVSYEEKPMFGCRACYLDGRLVIVLADREEPFCGVLVPTEKSFHQSLMSDLPALEVHSILGKWLYLAENTEEFEDTASELVELVAERDPRIGVEPKGSVG